MTERQDLTGGDLDRLTRRFVGGIWRGFRRTFRRGPRPAILMYHRIAEETFDPWGLAVTPKNFHEQMQWLAANRPVLPLDEFVHRQRNGELTGRATAITFDDGYACVAAVARPILERLGLPATVFVPADLIVRDQEFWWDELEQIVLGTGKDTLMLDADIIPLGKRSNDDRQWRPHAEPNTVRQKAFRTIWAKLKGKGPAELDIAMRSLRTEGTSASRESHRPMRADEAKASQSHLFQFGSHALTHSSLPRLSPADRAQEVAASMDRCASLTGAVPTAFAYPYGDYNAESRALVEEAGFACACTTANRFVSKNDAPYALPRLQVRDGNAGSLARLLLDG